jgi:hypothetical protein
VKTSDTIDQVSAALAAAQAKFPLIHMDKTATIPGKDGKSGYQYRYANLASIFQAIAPALSGNALAIVQGTHFENGALWLTTRLVHGSGQWIEGVWPLKIYERAQDQGSALTYARRYALSALLGIATDEDDDGAKASKRTPKITPEQTSNLVGIAKVAGLSKQDFLDKLEALVGHRVPAAIKAEEYQKVLDAFKPAVQA